MIAENERTPEEQSHEWLSFLLRHYQKFTVEVKDGRIWVFFEEHGREKEAKKWAKGSCSRRELSMFERFNEATKRATAYFST